MFLSQEAVSPLLLLQSLVVAPPEELHILAAILRTHIFNSARLHILQAHARARGAAFFRQGAETQTWLAPLHSCLSRAAAWLWTSISYCLLLPCRTHNSCHVFSVLPNGFSSFNDRLLLLYLLGGKWAIYQDINLSDNSLHNYSHDAPQLLIFLP